MAPVQRVVSLLLLQNLHVALCLNPDTSGLSERLESNPAILSSTTAIWVDGAGVDQQRAVAEAGIAAAVSATDAASGLDMEELTHVLQGIHGAAEQRSTTSPHHFAALVRQCLHVFGIKQAEILEQIEFLKVCR